MNAEYTGKQIAQRRKALGLTQKGLAERLNVTDKAVSKWERGLNFPDLGLMEELAAALDTTPAALLGLEDASRDEIVSSVTEISNEQLENAQRDAKCLGWGCIVAAALLVLADSLLNSKVVQKSQTGEQLLTAVTLAAVLGGFYLLFKYGQIRKFGTMDIGILYVCGISVGIILAIQFFTGHNPHAILMLCLISVAVGGAQLLFYRVMEPMGAKAIPVILSSVYLLWKLWGGGISVMYLVPGLCCLAVWMLCRIRRMK